MTFFRHPPSLTGVVDRLAHGQDRHGQRWHLQVPCEGQPFTTARPLLRILGLPTFGLAFAISVLTTYGPVVLLRLTDSTVAVGALIGGEGAFALAIPLFSGTLSDRRAGSPIERRFPFVLAGAPLIVGGLALLGFSGSIALAAVAVLAFFVGYYLYYPPYRALYADLLPRSFYPRAQASQAILRGAGLGMALLTGGLLLSVWRPLPFVLAGLAVVATTFALAPLLQVENKCPNPLLPYETLSVKRLLFRDRELRAFAGANALWEFSFSGLKTAVSRHIRERNIEPVRNGEAPDQQVADLAASFQASVVNSLVGTMEKQAAELSPKTLIVAGGVACNLALREAVEASASRLGVPVYFPSKHLSTDNAAMIAAAGHARLLRGETSGLDITADISLRLQNLDNTDAELRRRKVRYKL